MPLTSNIGTSNSLLGNIVVGLGAEIATGGISYIVTPLSMSVFSIGSTGSAQFTITLSASSSIPSTFNVSYTSILGSQLILSSNTVTIAAGSTVGTFTASIYNQVDIYYIQVSSIEMIPPIDYDIILSSSTVGLTPLIGADDRGGTTQEAVFTSLLNGPPAIIDYSGVSFGSIAISGGISEEFGILSNYLTLQTGGTFYGDISTHLSLLTTSVSGTSTGTINTYLVIKETSSGSISTSLVLKDSASGSINTYLTLRGGSIDVELTLKDTATGSIVTSLSLLQEDIGSISTKLVLGEATLGLLNTSLVLVSPYPYTPNIQVGASINSLLQDQRVNSRYRGSRETIKIAINLRGASKDLYTTTQDHINKSDEMSYKVLVFKNSYDTSIRTVQKHRTQINWRVRN